NVEKDYLYRVEDFEFIDGIFKVCKNYQLLGYKIIVVTNQSGIARGLYSEDDFNNITLWMVKEFKKLGIEISRVYHCPHHPDITGSCACRKPKPGMLLEAAKEFNIDLKHSIIIGDKERDIEAGLNAGLLQTFLFDENSKINKSKATKIIHRLEDIIC
ncbi:MAG: HAD family hydrolase, partial [Thiovulaceae bacterium]|nr:HAD family hydrolase [Sulfurimonadaceae bacterium]